MTEPTVKERFVYFEPLGYNGGEAQIIKFVLSDDDEIIRLAAQHVIRDGTCDCECFKFKHDCKHFAMVGDIDGLFLTLAEARNAVYLMNKWLHTYYLFVDLPNDPYVIIDGKVFSASVIACGVDKRKACPFPQTGKWRVMMPGTGFKVYVEIKLLQQPRSTAFPPR